MYKFLTVTGYLYFAFSISRRDIKFRKIFNKELSLFLVFTIATRFSDMDHHSLKRTVWVTLTLAILHAIFSKQIGAGDLKLFWVISFWANSWITWLQLFSLVWVLGGVFSVSAAIFHRKFSGNIPFAPFIFLGFLPVIFA
jgi:hypothetical protein